MRERSAQIATTKAAEIEARQLAQDFIKQRTEAVANPTPEAAKPPQEGREQSTGPAIESKAALIECGRYSGPVKALHEHFVYQARGRDTIRHERKHFSELPKPGDELSVSYALGSATVKNHDREKELGSKRGMSR